MSVRATRDGEAVTVTGSPWSLQRSRHVGWRGARPEPRGRRKTQGCLWPQQTYGCGCKPCSADPGEAREADGKKALAVGGVDGDFADGGLVKGHAAFFEKA